MTTIEDMMQETEGSAWLASMSIVAALHPEDASTDFGNWRKNLAVFLNNVATLANVAAHVVDLNHLKLAQGSLEVMAKVADTDVQRRSLQNYRSAISYALAFHEGMCKVSREMAEDGGVCPHELKEQL